MSDLYRLTDEQMTRLEPYLPKSHGKPRVDDRRVLSGIVFVNRNGLPWCDAPKEYGPHKTLYNRWKRLGERGVFLRMMEGLAVFVGAGETPADWVAVGRACQRFALQATALGLKHAFINQPVEVPRLRPDLATLIGAPGRRPDIVMRFGYGPTLPWSLRRPVDSVIVT
jgi:transposase